jgi:hypothetical protein
MLEDLTPTPKVEAPKNWKPAVEFNGTEGEATTQGYLPEEKPDFDQFLEEAGFDSKTIEVVGEPRTSRWQVARPFPLDPQWLTAYRFRFRKITVANQDLPTLYAEAKKTRPPVTKQVDNGKAFVLLAADYQVGKNDLLGGTPELIQRVLGVYDKIELHLKKNKYERIIVADVGDIIENFESKANTQQVYSNDKSLMGQVDLATTLIWELLKMTTKYAPVTYASVASNHCQNRINKQQVGKPGEDDWGVMIAKQLHRLCVEVGLPVKVLIPQPYDESLAFDVFDDGYHILGLWHGHQSSRPEGVPDWWKKQAFGMQPVSAATIGVTGHFHHMRVQELGLGPNGNSRYWIQGSTMDNGSNYFRLSSGEMSTPGMTVFELGKLQPFNGSVWKL